VLQDGELCLAPLPRPGGGLAHAGTVHESPYGRIEVAWRRAGDGIELTVVVPPGVTALVELPDPSFTPVDIGSGRHSFTCSFVE
jgi:alpha-L-rhamnosidase